MIFHNSRLAHRRKPWLLVTLQKVSRLQPLRTSFLTSTSPSSVWCGTTPAWHPRRWNNASLGTPRGPLLRWSINLLYLSTSFLWWQVVAAILGVKSSNALRMNSRCTWRHREGVRHVDYTAIRRALSPLHSCESVMQTSTAAPEVWHRSGTLSRSGTTRWRTREVKRPNDLTMPRDALPTRLSSFRLLAMASPHWMLIGNH